MKISLQVWFMEKAASSKKEEKCWREGGRGKGPVDAQEWEPNFKFTNSIKSQRKSLATCKTGIPRESWGSAVLSRARLNEWSGEWQREAWKEVNFEPTHIPPSLHTDTPTCMGTNTCIHMHTSHIHIYKIRKGRQLWDSTTKKKSKMSCTPW